MLNGKRHLVLIMLVVGAVVVGVLASPAGTDDARANGPRQAAANVWPIPRAYYAGCDCLDNGDELPDCW